MKNKVLEAVLWLAFVLAMLASIQHLAWVFGTVERPGKEWLGWVPAVAVDAGLAALAYTIQQRKRVKRPVAILWWGVAGFALVSAGANFYHALAVEGVALSAGWIVYAKALVLGATLPVAYIFLGEIISGDDATAAERQAKQAEREQRRADLQAERETAEAKRLLLEAERQANVSETQAKSAYRCAACGRSFASQNGLNAHRCEVKTNGSETQAKEGE